MAKARVRARRFVIGPTHVDHAILEEMPRGGDMQFWAIGRWAHTREADIEPIHARALRADWVITRRAFPFAFGALAACLRLGDRPSAAEVQQSASRRRIGVLLVLLSPAGTEAQAFRQGLRDAGYVEGRDVVIEWRSANGDYARLPQLAADLVERKVDLIVADTTPATQAAQRATSTIPIVMAIVALIQSDPV
jgi:hypothetical protein